MIDLLDDRTLTRLMTRIKPVRPRSAPFFGTGQSVVPNDKVEWEQVRGHQNMVNYRDPGGEGGVSQDPEHGIVKCDLMSLREKVLITPKEEKWLRRPGTTPGGPRYAEQIILRKLQNLRNKMERRKEATRWDLVQDGIASLPVERDDGSVTLHTADFKMLSDHKIDLSGAGDTWSDPDNDIIGAVGDIRRLMAQDSVNGEVVDAYTTSEVIEWIEENASAREIMSDSIKRARFEGSDSIRFKQINWHQVDGGYRLTEAKDSTFRTYIDQHDTNRYVIFKTSGTKGREYTTVALDSDNTENVTGTFVKAWRQKDPSGLWVLACETSIPVLEEPDDIIVAQVA